MSLGEACLFLKQLHKFRRSPPFSLSNFMSLPFAQAILLKDGQEEKDLLLKHFYPIKMKRKVQ
jgi:hypothetical protein